MQQGSVQNRYQPSWPKNASAFQASQPLVMLHGGLGDQLESPKDVLKSMQSLATTVRQKWKRNPQMSATDLALTAVYELECEPTFNAGYGAKLQADGIPRLTASLMDGARQRFASVSNIYAVDHASSVAKLLINERDRNLCSSEANRYALANGFTPRHVETPKRVQEWIQRAEGSSGTVGAVALDVHGNLAACTSTGGRGFEIPGRVSDSGTPAGNFASPFGAVSCTGTGEEILEAATASSVVARLEDGMGLAEAIDRTFYRHQSKNFGIIAVDARGRISVHATKGFLIHAIIGPEIFHVGITAQDWSRFNSNQ